MERKHKNILMISVRADHGGGPKHISLLVDGLKSKFNIFIACPNDEPYFDIFAGLVGIQNMIQIPHRKFEIQFLLKLIAFVWKYNIDLIHSHGKGAGLYGRLTAFFTFTQSVHTFHGVHLGEYGYLKKFLYLKLEQFLSLISNKIITVSKSEQIKILGNKICRTGKLRLIENGIKTTEFKISTNLYETSNFNIITISRFDHAKNSEHILTIFDELKKIADIKKFIFHFLGSGENMNTLKNEALNRSGENFVFHGNVNNPSEFLTKSHCYLSTSRWEGLPLGIMEAMSVGLPVIASDVVGNMDIVEHDVNGYLFDLNRPESAAAYILKLSGDQKIWDKFSSANFKKIKNFYNAGIMIDKTETLYNSLLN